MFRYYYDAVSEGLRKIMGKLNKDSRFPGRDFDPAAHGIKDKAGTLSTRPQRSVPMFLLHTYIR
jgi:hypothetical protein